MRIVFLLVIIVKKTEKTEIVSPLERIGRLGLKTVKFDIGSGGTPFFKGCEYAAVLSGLSRLEMAWVTYAYINVFGEYELNYIVLSFKDYIAREAELPIEISIRVVELSCRECCYHQTLSDRLRASFMGVSRGKFERNKNKIHKAMDIMRGLLAKVEDEIIKKITAQQ